MRLLRGPDISRNVIVAGCECCMLSAAVAIGKPERQVRKASHCGSEQQ